jgi:hypothetical protein
MCIIWENNFWCENSEARSVHVRLKLGPLVQLLKQILLLLVQEIYQTVLKKTFLCSSKNHFTSLYKKLKAQKI